jgi:uncharacterized caspase-like protein
MRMRRFTALITGLLAAACATGGAMSTINGPQPPLSFPEDVNFLLGRWDGEVHIPNDPLGPKRTLILRSFRSVGENAWLADGRYGSGGRAGTPIQAAVAIERGHLVVRFLTNYRSRLDLALTAPDTLAGTFELYPGQGSQASLSISLQRHVVPKVRLDLRAPANAEFTLSQGNGLFQTVQIDESGFVRLFIEPGTYTVLVSKDGLQPWNETLSVRPTDTHVERVAVLTVPLATPAPSAATASAPTVLPAPRSADSWAVVIGIGEYDSRQIPRLRYATQDADAMYDFLTKSGGYAKDHVLLLTNTSQMKPTLLNIKRALGDFLARRAGRDDTVLIYFAGHGAPEVDVAGTESDGLSKYLIPQDGDPDSLYTSALPMDEIQRIFARIQAERILLLLDTCYSGTAGGRSFARQRVRATGLNDQFLERLARNRGRVIITASGPNEVALELDELGHGLFTYYILEGLRGKADRNGDGIVTVSELYEYVEDQVDRAARRAGGRQQPLMKGELEGSLPISILHRD